MAHKNASNPDYLQRLLLGLFVGVVSGQVDREVLRVATAAIKQLQALWETTALEKRLQEVEKTLKHHQREQHLGATP